jgi:hypothetical protein
MHRHLNTTVILLHHFVAIQCVMLMRPYRRGVVNSLTESDGTIGPHLYDKEFGILMCTPLQTYTEK